LEVTDDFIKEFNGATDPANKERLQCQSQKMLERIKVVISTHWNLSFISDPKMHTYFVENLTPIVLLLSWLNSLHVNWDHRLLLPTPESPIS